MKTSDRPRILGAFSLRRGRDTGYAGASRQARTVTLWFAVQREPDVYTLRALSPELLPTQVTTRLDRVRFLTDYAPEPETYTREVLPRLHRRLTDLGVFPDLDPATVRARDKELKALGLACSDPDQTLALLECLRRELAKEPGDMAADQSGTIVNLAIGQRKLKMLHEALDSYFKALTLSPLDDHLHFNMARAFYELEDWENALTHALKALELNPDLSYAQKLVDSIDRRQVASRAGLSSPAS